MSAGDFTYEKDPASGLMELYWTDKRTQNERRRHLADVLAAVRSAMSYWRIRYFRYYQLVLFLNDTQHLRRLYFRDRH